MWPIIDTEAVAAGELTRGVLRWNYTAIHPNVYLLNGARRSLYVNTIAAWLWTGRRGIIAGRAAAALHCVRWIDDTVPIELIAKHGRRQPGVVIRDERIDDDEVYSMGELTVTTPARTALDLGRRLPRNTAVAHLDALAAVTGITATDIWPLEERYRATRGIRAAHIAINLMDGGARSPRETSLRLMLIDAGLPRPRTGIVLRDNGSTSACAANTIENPSCFERARRCASAVQPRANLDRVARSRAGHAARAAAAGAQFRRPDRQHLDTRIDKPRVGFDVAFVGDHDARRDG
jgi:hypothetical protein